MRTYLLVVLTCIVGILFGQQRPTAPYVADDAPEWVKMLADDAPNVWQVREAYGQYYEAHPFEKNTYTQFYKRWMHWARPFTQADGSLVLPTVADAMAKEKQLLQLRGEGQTRNQLGDWSFVGPKNTFDTDGTTRVTWQTNIYSLCVAPSDANIVYAGGEGGGLWKTTDKGLHWSLLTAGILHGSIGAVRVHPTNPDIVLFGTGGKIVRSTDGGATWETVYSANNLWVNDIAISDADPNILLAAADQGLLRSVDGGTSWSSLFSNQTWSVKMKVGDPNTVYVSRKSGSSADFLISTDGGATFAPSNSGLWTPTAGLSIGGGIVAVCPSNPERLYLYYCGNGGSLFGYVGVFVSNDGGATWINTHPTAAVGNSPTAYSIPNHTNLMAHDGTTGFDQGFYDMAIIVNPTNANQLIAGGTSWFKSNDGGTTWLALGSYVGGLSWSHPDMQALAVHGTDLWIATDGGLNYSNNWATSIEARMNGISGSDMWGFDAGWNEDILVGGRYHNGNMAWFENFPEGDFYRMGGAEAPTGYVNPGPERKIYHSDIGGHRLLGDFTAGVTSFAVGTFPNESYAYFANSEMEWHPNCWNTVYLGKDQKIWRSTDGGSSFAVLYNFGGVAANQVYDIEICRADPQHMYVSKFDGTDDRVWRSTDAGVTWTQCTNLPTPNNNDRIRMAVSEADPLTLWVSVSYGSNGKKIYKTTDGGATWQNLTTNILNGVTISGIMAQYGTDGGVYLGTDGGVFYRNNSMTDWVSFSDNLPLSAQTNRLKPFYRDGKIRNGCWSFGVWESALYEPSTNPLPVAMCNKLYSGCQRDTLFFDDHSAVQHSEATWQWQFPDAAWTSATNVRNPSAFYNSAGSKMAIMGLTHLGQTSYDTLFIEIGNECAADSVPGFAVRLGGNNNAGSIILPPLGVATNNFTVTAWVKADGIQPDYASIFMHDGDESAGLHFQPGSNHLGYHWPNGQWWWDSGLECPSGAWTHVALVVQPNKVTIYVNGVGATQNISLPPVNFSSGSQLGSYKSWGDRYMKGDLDEVCIYNAAMTQDEIREKMHLRKIPDDETAMLAYYQFNEPTDAVAYDRAHGLHAGLSGSAARITSTVAVGPGASFRKNIASGGVHNFTPSVGLILQLPNTGTFPNGEVVATRINLNPDQLPSLDSVSRAYWVVHNFGNDNITAPDGYIFDQIGYIGGGTDANDINLYHRQPNGEGNTWETLGAATNLTVGPDGTAIFGNGINTLQRQFVINRGDLVAVQSPVSASNRVRIAPNPVPVGSQLNISTDLLGEATFRLFDAQGRVVRRTTFSRQTTLDTNGLAAATYYYIIENESFMRGGKVVILNGSE